MNDENKIIELEEKIKKIEAKLSSSMIFNKSIIKRSISIFGHNILAQLILFIPIIFFLGLILGLLSKLFTPSILDQGW